MVDCALSLSIVHKFWCRAFIWINISMKSLSKSNATHAFQDQNDTTTVKLGYLSEQSSVSWVQPWTKRQLSLLANLLWMPTIVTNYFYNTLECNHWTHCNHCPPHHTFNRTGRSGTTMGARETPRCKAVLSGGSRGTPRGPSHSQGKHSGVHPMKATILIQWRAECDQNVWLWWYYQWSCLALWLFMSDILMAQHGTTWYIQQRWLANKKSDGIATRMFFSNVFEYSCL